jgi:tetratricopeptide (TPR) repeat protein
LLLGSVENGLAQYSAAITELEHAAASLPENAEVQYELAVALAHSQNPNEAVPHFDKAIALKPSDWRAQAELAAVLREAGETARVRDAASRAELLKAYESKIKRLPEKDRQAADLLHGGHADKAAEIYREMLVVDPGNARTEHNLARALAAAHDSRGERLELERAVRHDPKLAVALGDLGRLDMAEGKSEAAEKHLEAALAADPQLVSAVGDLGVLRANKGDTEGAEKLFREAVEDDPNYEQGHLNLGLTLAKQQKFREAEAEVDEAVRLAPDDLNAMAAAGRVKARVGKSAESVALLRKVVARAPQSATAHLDLGMVLAESYDLADALVENTDAVRLAPGSPLAHFNRGRVLFDLGRNEQARPDLETATRLAPEMAEPYYFLAMIEKQAGRYNRAVTLLQNLVKLQPRKATSWYLLGQCLAYDSQTQEAIVAWRQAIAIDPDYTQALWNLAQALKRTDPDEAARLTARYSEVQKKRLIVDQAGTLGNNALAAGAAHDWPEAVREFQKAIEVCGECAIKADLHKKLGITDCEMGDIDNGEKELRLAQALKPGDPDIERVLTRIAIARAKRVSPPPARKDN